MAEPRQRRRRRLGLVFAGSLVIHACLFLGVARDRVRPFLAVDDAPRPTPVSFAPLPAPARRDPVQHKRRPASPPRPSVAITSLAEVKTAAGQEVRLAQALEPASPLAAVGLPDANQIVPGDAGAPAQTDGGPDHYPINPGYWEVVLHWLLVDRTERYCVEPQSIARFMAVPCNHIYHCSEPTEVFEGDKFRFEEVVTGNHERFDVKGHGDYAPERLHVSARIQRHYKILPVVILGSLDGRYLGDCPPGARRVRQR